MHKIKLILLLILPLSVIGQDLGIIDTKTTKNPAINGTHRISTDGQNLFFRNFFGVSKKIANTDSPTFTGNVKISSLGTGDYVKVGLNGLLYSDNTFASDALSATQSALDLKANITSPTFISDATTPRLKITGVGDIGKGSDLVMGGNSNDLTMHGTGKVILGTGGFQRLVVTNAGNVGVGTTAPVAKFEVSGLAGFRYNDGKQADGKYLRSNSTGVAAWDSVKASEVFGLNTTYLPINNPTATGTLTAPTIANSLGATFATTSGNVGIGTTSPATKLSVSGSVGINTVAQSLILNNSTGVYSTYQYNGTSVGDIGTSNQAITGGGTNDFAFTSRTGNLVLGTGSIERMRIFANGNIGVGITTDAGYKLDVNGSARATRFEASSTTAITLTNNGNQDFHSSGASAKIRFIDSGYANENLTIDQSGNTYIRGNLGVGTISPTQKLDINGNIKAFSVSGGGAYYSSTTATDAAARNWVMRGNSVVYGDFDIRQSNALNGDPIAAGNSRFYINPNGNVGIGTTAPTEKLEVFNGNYTNLKISANQQSSIKLNTTTLYGVNNPNAELYNNYGNVGLTLYPTPTATRNDIIYYDNTDKETQFQTDGSTKLRIRGNGNVLIGTPTDAGYKLDVNGTVRAGSTTSQSGALISARNTGNSFEFGHPNQVGYGSTLGANSGNGFSFLAFNAEAGTTNNTFRTRGLNGRIIINDINNNRLQFQRTTSSSADNQTPVVDMTIDGSGNVGIGTTAPTQKFEVRNDINADVAIRIENRGVVADGTSNSLIFGGYRDTQSIYDVAKISAIHKQGVFGNANHAGELAFYTQLASAQTNPDPVVERMRISSTGNVGIGTAPTTRKLEVTDAIRSISNFAAFESIHAISGTSYRWTLNNDNNYLLQSSSDKFVANATTRLSLFDGGNIGIGTSTNAGYKLNVIGGVSNFADNILLSGGGTNNKIGFNADAVNYYIQGINSGIQYSPYSVGNFTFTSGAGNWSFTNGNVGIGTNAPATNLHVNRAITSAFPLIRLETTGAGGRPYMDFKAEGVDYGYMGWGGTSNNNMFIQNYLNADLQFGTNSATRMTIRGGGNVLIGTTTDLGYKLDVSGTAQATQFKLSALNTAPASATATGTTGEIRVDANYIYICTATNTWKRSAITSW